MSTVTRKNNLTTVNAIGRGVRLTETAVEAIVSGLPDTFDPKARGAITGVVHAWACGDDERPAVKIGPKGSQRATDYGRGVDALVTAVKRALSADEPKPVRLSVTLSGDGVDGGSFIVPADHAMYEALVALVASANSDGAAA